MSDKDCVNVEADGDVNEGDRPPPIEVVLANRITRMVPGVVAAARSYAQALVAGTVAPLTSWDECPQLLEALGFTTDGIGSGYPSGDPGDWDAGIRVIHGLAAGVAGVYGPSREYEKAGTATVLTEPWFFDSGDFDGTGVGLGEFETAFNGDLIAASAAFLRSSATVLVQNPDPTAELAREVHAAGTNRSVVIGAQQLFETKVAVIRDAGYPIQGDHTFEQRPEHELLLLTLAEDLIHANHCARLAAAGHDVPGPHGEDGSRYWANHIEPLTKDLAVAVVIGVREHGQPGTVSGSGDAESRQPGAVEGDA